MNKWKCSICGYIFTGEQPPESCPSCGAPQEAFEPLLKKPSGDKKPDGNSSTAQG